MATQPRLKTERASRGDECKNCGFPFDHTTDTVYFEADEFGEPIDCVVYCSRSCATASINRRRDRQRPRRLAS